MNKSVKTPSFTEQHTDYLIERHVKPDHVLATELNSIFNTHFSGNDVAKKREELKLPAPDPEKSVAAVLLSSRKEAEPVTEKNGPLSAAQMKGRKPKKQPAAIRDSFESAGNKTPDALESLLKEKRDNSNFTFAPVYVTQPKAGAVYVYPRIGPVKCTGLDTIKVAGADMRTVSFEELYPVGIKRTVRFDPAKIASKEVREPADEKIMDDILYKLAHGKSEIKRVPVQAAARKSYFDRIMASSNLADVTDLLCFTFGGKKDLKSLSSLDTTYGNLCVDLLAAEYAYVRKVPVAEAKGLIERAVGKPTLEQLARYNDGRILGGEGPNPSA